MTIGSKQLFARADTLWIRDGIDLHAMMPDGRVIASQRVNAPMQGFSGTILLDDGRMLTTGLSGPEAKQFHLSVLALSARSPVTPPMSFGTVSPEERRVARDAPRAVGYAGGQIFWVGPFWRPATGSYTVEQWSTDGRQLQQLRRDASWFVGGQATQRGPTDRPPPAVPLVHIDSSGILWVVTVVPTSRWSATTPMDSTMELRLDAIRIHDGQLLATLGPLLYGDALRRLPSSLFPGSRHGVRIEEDEQSGLPVAHIVELRLEPRQ